MKWVLAIGLITLTGCSATATAPPAHPLSQSSVVPTASIGASPQPDELLFAVSSGNQCGLGCVNAVAIVGLDGRVRAQAKFTPPPLPSLGNEGSFVVATVQVVAGSVFYIDSGNVVHRLKASGENQVVARFRMLTSQQITWFAVSPDGTKVMASIMAFPPPVSPSTLPSQGGPQRVQGDLRQELEVATVGGPTTAVMAPRSPPSTATAPAPLVTVVGWDKVGPIATTDTHMAFIDYVDGTVWMGSAAHLDSQGRPGRPIGGSDCIPDFGELPNGTLVCYDPKEPTVRDTAGNILWRLKPLDPKDTFTYGNIVLSPDASHVAFSLDSQCCYVFDSSVIRSRDGTRIVIGSGFQPQGWLDHGTVIGVKGTVQPTCSGCPPDFVADNIAVVRLATPTKIEDLGFKGTFLGVVQGL